MRCAPTIVLRADGTVRQAVRQLEAVARFANDALRDGVLKAA